MFAVVLWSLVEDTKVRSLESCGSGSRPGSATYRLNDFQVLLLDCISVMFMCKISIVRVNIIANSNVFSWCLFLVYFVLLRFFFLFLLCGVPQVLNKGCHMLVTAFILPIYCPFRGCYHLQMCFHMPGHKWQSQSYFLSQSAGLVGSGVVPEVRLKEMMPVHKEELCRA